ncbi:recombination regulator RecX [Guyparkeria hydrothermalis]|uniref:Regulatory protein RecX n=1 Tax=Guyparkeria halophila TaxID=47960 RepID=A0A6I6CYB0_9GAMM|nr:MULTISPECIES: regulatory protein RecX [Guyparkeria]MCL7750809.1 recombination regulator RecX [Guyparkeria hydrothermalis]QGT79199.1 regulatory protein RecX [Guyparkeria halophila]TKA88870.1 regulatory protein RecX [Guyparkeria sp. SB14A]
MDDEKRRRLDCEKRAVGLLARREHSRLELARKLADRGFAADEVDPVLDRLVEEGWQSDRRYAESLIRARAARRYGPDRIANELAQQGVDEGVASEAFAAEPQDWAELAREQLLARFREPPADFPDRARRHRHLVRRGFPPDLSHELAGWWPDEDVGPDFP